MKNKKRILILVAMLALSITMLFTTTASAASYRKTTTDSYSCRAHNRCQQIYFTSHGNTSNGYVYDKYFSGHRSHWPNAFRYDNVWSYRVGNTGYAKGKYTIYSSLITQWASISFSSSSSTITHVY